MRDTRKSAAYFNDCLAQFARRSGLMRDRISDTDDELRLRRCHWALVSFAESTLHCAFSVGADGDLMAHHARNYAKAEVDYLGFCGAEPNGYQALMSVATSLALFGTDEDRQATRQQFERLGVDSPEVLALLRLEKIAPTPQDNSRSLLVEFLGAEGTEQDAQSLFEFVAKGWYRSNKREPWYNTHSKETGYRGYWCFGGGAVAKIQGYDTEGWSVSPYWHADAVEMGERALNDPLERG